MKRIITWLLCGLLLSTAAQAGPVAFAAVVAGQPLHFPADFGAHPDFKTEWWYVTGWLQRPNGKPLGFQVTFFRSRTGAADANPSAFAARQLIVAHAAVSDPALGRLVHDQKSGRQGFELNYAKAGMTSLKLDGWTMQRGANGAYQVAIASRQLQLKLTLTPTAPPLLQGVAGFSQKGPLPRNASYYYSEPQLQVTGVAGALGAAGAVTGTAWLDHEWSSQALDPAASGWDWVGANLADGSALMAFQIRARRGGKLWAHAALRDRAGKVTQFGADQVSFSARAWWTSPASGATYPVATTLVTGPFSWRLTPLQNDQELDSRRSTGAIYWEGAMSLERDGQPAGHGYLEMTGYDRPMTL
ncbi:lipocalin-like domain-containing protein [Massilia sp. PWRC2]|uniref:lipocalin-like domain-containing protein n=1 Tax=Massilia sp. PWRC2 TaxID=2804626 RepID=UPI003CEB0096